MIEVDELPALEKLLVGCDDQEKNFRINGIAARYLDLIAHELRQLPFTKDEWMAFLDANNGAQIEFIHPIAVSNAWANVADTPNLGAKWGIDAQHLAEHIERLPLSARTAMYEAACIFWHNANDPTDVAMTKAMIQAR
jgi:hypothetical protein